MPTASLCVETIHDRSNRCKDRSTFLALGQVSGKNGRREFVNRARGAASAVSAAVLTRYLRLWWYCATASSILLISQLSPRSDRRRLHCFDMLTSSSPTISAPASPATTFHAPSRSYHAPSRHTSNSPCAVSPRFAVSSVSARRFESPHISRPAIPVPSPVPAPSRSPQGSKRGYVDIGTQYSPAGFPPTYRSLSRPNPTDKADPAPLTAPAIVEQPRGQASAAPAITEPPEPAVQANPQPATPIQNAQPPSQRASREIAREGQPEAPPRQIGHVPNVLASPAKRVRAQEPSVKVMPLKYETCDVKDLGVLISDMLMELVRLNDGYPLRDGQLTRFHSRCVACVLLCGSVY